MAIILLNDDLLEVFEFIPRFVLATSISLVNYHFNEMAQSKMHICRKHWANKIVIFGRHLREANEWRECCLASGDLNNYEPHYLRIGHSFPENIVGIRELMIRHFSGSQLVHFLSQTIGHLLSECTLEIRFVESLFTCVGTERAEFDEFMQKFHEKCNAISVYSYERHFQMPQFLLCPNIFAKVRLFQLNDSIPEEYLDLLINWLHTPFLCDVKFEEKKLQFRTGNQELINKLIEKTKKLFKLATSSSSIQFRIAFVYIGFEPTNQFEHNWNFIEQNDLAQEMLTLRSLFFPKMFELHRRKANENVDEKNGDQQNNINIRGKMNNERIEECKCKMLVTVFSQPIASTELWKR